MNTVKLYKITVIPPEGGTTVHFSLYPLDENSLFSGYKGEDDGGREYIIPDGYAVKENWQGEKYIGRLINEDGVEQWLELPITIYDGKYPAIDDMVFNLNSGKQKILRFIPVDSNNRV